MALVTISKTSALDDAVPTQKSRNFVIRISETQAKSGVFNWENQLDLGIENVLDGDACSKNNATRNLTTTR